MPRTFPTDKENQAAEKLVSEVHEEAKRKYPNSLPLQLGFVMGKLTGHIARLKITQTN